MTQPQTKNGCQKKYEWWEWPWKKNTLKDMPHVPKDFEYELTNLNSVVGWSKSLDGLPQFSVENIEKYADIVTAGELSRSTVVKNISVEESNY